MNVEAVKTKCPQCNEIVKNANNLGIFMAEMNIEGMLEN